MKWRDHYVVKIFNSFPFHWNAITGTKLDYHCTHYHYKTSSTQPVWMTSTSRNRWLVRMRYLRVNFKEDSEKRRCSPIKQRLCIGIAVLFVLLLCIILAATCTRNSGPSGELLGKFAVNLTGSCCGFYNFVSPFKGIRGYYAVDFSIEVFFCTHSFLPEGRYVSERFLVHPE